MQWVQGIVNIIVLKHLWNGLFIIKRRKKFIPIKIESSHNLTLIISDLPNIR